jgi:hypothetical protein
MSPRASRTAIALALTLPLTATLPARAGETTPAPPAPAPEASSRPADPGRLKVGGPTGWFQPSALLQAWFLLDRTSGGDAAAGRDATTSTFRLRRAEIAAKGEIVKGRIAYGVMFDPAKVLEPTNKTYTTAAGDTVTVPTAPKAISVLQDLYISVLTAYADVSIGQFKIPVSWEGYNSSSRLLFPERAQISSRYGDKRDLGVKVSKELRYFGYHLGLYNGQGLNNLDTNNSKDLALRLEGYPVAGLVVGGVVYHEIKASSTPYKKRRYEADLRFARGPFLFQGEYLYGVDRAPTDSADHTGQGFYAAAAWTFKGRLQPALRFGLLDPDTSKGKDYTTAYEAVVSYYFLGNHAKAQLSYSRFQETSASGKKSTNEVILAAQVHY